MFSVVYKDLT